MKNYDPSGKNSDKSFNIMNKNMTAQHVLLQDMLDILRLSISPSKMRSKLIQLALSISNDVHYLEQQPWAIPIHDTP
jgi:hypothetical protein